MGGHYGAIHVRTDDLAAVRAGVDALSASLKLKFYIGPPIRGWIGVYPAGNGQDAKVSAALAQKLDADMLHLIVHDDSVFAYVFYQQRAEADRYDSCPKYFSDDVSDQECRATEGKPELLQHLLKKSRTLAEARELLRRRDLKEEVFIRDRAVRFAELFAIPNAIEAYEYLKEEETDEIEQWKKFIHVPDLKAELQDKRRAKSALREKVMALRRQGKLFLVWSKPAGKTYDVPPTPHVMRDAAHNGFLVSWERSGVEPTPLMRLVPPWKDHQNSGIVVPVYDQCLVTSASGKYLAAGSASRGVTSVLMKNNWNIDLWDLKTEKLIAHHSSNYPMCPIVFTADETALICMGDKRWHSLSTADGSMLASCESELARSRNNFVLRSDGNLLLEANGKVGLFELATGMQMWTFYIGGKYSLAAQNDKALELLQKMVDAQLEEKYSGAELEARRKIALEHLKAQLEGTRQKMETAMKHLGGGKIPEPDTGMSPAFALEFNADESILFVGTHSGCMVFDWSEIRKNANPRPRTVIPSRSSDDPNFGTYVYSLAFDSSKDLLIIGGNGKLHYYHVASGRTGVLLTPPAPASFTKLCLSPDRSALACACHFMTDRDNRNDRQAPELQIWNYPALLKEADLTS